MAGTATTTAGAPMTLSDKVEVLRKVLKQRLSGIKHELGTKQGVRLAAIEPCF